MSTNITCYCGSERLFSHCCQPLITYNKEAQTPEQLMRSRFSAYVMNNSQYIYDTYAKSSQASQSVKEINHWSEGSVWIALQIHFINNNDVTITDSPEQFVEFSAFYISDNTLFELRENSRFIIEDSDKEESKPLKWRYIDGDIIKHCELTKIKRKEQCPCNNYPTAWSTKKGKKFKQCCGKL